MANRFWSRKWGAFPLDEYRSWHSMVRRCCDRRERAFKRYGGRGIRVCDRWRDDFMAFLSDMGPRPTPAYSLDRIDNEGPYTPENCRWATPSQQSQNRDLVRNATGIRREANRWQAEINAGGRSNHLGSFETRAAATLAYRRAARRRRIVSELSAAWAREAAAVAQGVADRYDGALDRQLLDVLIRASRPPGYRGSCKSPCRHPDRDQNARRQSMSARHSRQSKRNASAGSKPRERL
jgi:hypothetical protein